MVFSSYLFLFAFLPISLLVLSLLYNKGSQRYNLCLCIFSLLFYAIGEKALVLVLVFSAFLDYFAAHKIEEARAKQMDYKAKHWLSLSIISNLSILFVFKYFHFFESQTIQVFQHLGLNLDPVSFQIIMPLGISFYTFQSMSYTLDVYYQKIRAIHNKTDYLCYVSMFPQLVAGPVVRFRDIMEDLKVKHFDVYTGIERFCIGLAKKVIIADNIAIYADLSFNAQVTNISPTLAWAGLFAYAFQIYFDFSAYSDMAIGLGRILGFRFPENFNYPYVATSIQSFWRRWHISLSSWFRDYLYIPLGGNRHGFYKTSRNLFIVFLLCGFWHGASWNFIAWGVFHGLFLSIERVLSKLKIKKHYSLLPISYLYTVSVVLSAWILFRARDLEHAYEYFLKLVLNPSVNFQMILENTHMLFSFIIALFFFTPITYQVFLKLPKAFRLCACFALFILCVLEINLQSFSPFIYFRF